MMDRLKKTPLPWMVGMATMSALVMKGVGILLNAPEMSVNAGSLAAGFAGLVYGLIIWAETGNHSPPAVKK